MNYRRGDYPRGAGIRPRGRRVESALFGKEEARENAVVPIKSKECGTRSLNTNMGAGS